MHGPDGIGKGTAGLRVHGGRIDLAASLYPSAPKPWIDLSTGINPVPWPIGPIALARYQRLPFASEIAETTEAAAAAYGLPANAAMLPVPGSEMAIRLLPRMIGLGSAGILAPTYGSHATAWRNAGAEVHELAGLPDPDRQDFKTLILVNPNNPDGRMIARAELVAFAKAWTTNGRRLIVDEAFADVRPEVSLLALPDLPVGTTVLRSLGKFFGLAGLRVGFRRRHRARRVDLAAIARGLARVRTGLRDRDRGTARHRMDRRDADEACCGSKAARWHARSRWPEIARRHRFVRVVRRIRRNRSARAFCPCRDLGARFCRRIAALPVRAAGG